MTQKEELKDQLIKTQAELNKNYESLIRQCDSPSADNPRFDMVLELTKNARTIKDRIATLTEKLDHFPDVGNMVDSESDNFDHLTNEASKDDEQINHHLNRIKSIQHDLGLDSFKSSPIEWMHGKLLDAFHAFRTLKTQEISVSMDSSDFSKIVVAVKKQLYEEYKELNLDKAIPINEASKQDSTIRKNGTVEKAEPVGSAEEILRKKFEDFFLDIDYLDLYLQAMEEYATLRVTEALQSNKEKDVYEIDWILSCLRDWLESVKTSDTENNAEISGIESVVNNHNHQEELEIAIAILGKHSASNNQNDK